MARNRIQTKPTMKKRAPGEETEETGDIRKSKDYKSLMGSLRQREPGTKMPKSGQATGVRAQQVQTKGSTSSQLGKRIANTRQKAYPGID